MDKDSAKLYNAVKKAYDKGILIIAAAGNGGKIQYPAKYEEVMAVGAVTCNGVAAKEGSTGKELEVVAPGQDITSYGPFGMLTSFSGSSMAAPQVSALAAVLWQQDLTKSSDFIRQLIDVTARSLGSREKYGYGLIDCEYALKNYHEFEKQYRAPESSVQEYGIDSNTETLLCLDEEMVKGYWAGKKHREMVEKFEIVNAGVVWPDKKESKVNGHENPAFHGYSDYNYVEAYLFISEVAAKMYKTGEWVSEKDCTEDEKKLLKKIKVATEKNGFTAFEKKCTTRQEKGLFLYGMAIHTVGDIFSHSTTGIKGNDKDRTGMEKKKLKTLCAGWKKFRHSNGTADNTKCLEKRWDSAKAVCMEIINISVSPHKKGTKEVFTKIKYYKKCSTAKKYKKNAQKKKYLLNSYGILKLSTYLKPGSNKELKKVVNNASNSKIKKVIEKWK